MDFDFTTVWERRGHDAIAVDALYEEGPHPRVPETVTDPLPMWIADMNFATAPAVTEAIARRLAHPLFGYFAPREEYFDSILRWQKARNGRTDITRADIRFENGVLGGVINALNVCCSRADKVLVHSPVYVGFTGVLANNGYQAVHSPLIKDAQGVWRMDFDDMEKKVTEQKIHAVIFCSPHNPTGRVWEKEEVEAFMDFAKRHDLTVLSDEIWSDLLLDGHKHVPTQSVSEDARMRTVTFHAPTKTFSLAGLTGSYRICPNKKMQERLDREASLSHFNNLNVLSMYSVIGAFSPEGEAWLDALLPVLSENVRILTDFLQGIPGVSLTPPEGTYMLFPDFTEWCRLHGRTLDDMLTAAWAAGVAIQDGRPFFGENCVRINAALPTARVREAVERLRKIL